MMTDETVTEQTWDGIGTDNNQDVSAEKPQYEAVFPKDEYAKKIFNSY